MTRSRLALAALLVTLVAVFALFGRLEACRPVVALFGPDPVTLHEAYADSGQGTFDHGDLDALLKAHVTADGRVDYAAIAADPARLDAYLARLAEAPFEGLSRDEKLALLINAYNAFTLKLMVERWPIASIKDVPSAERWKARRWRLAGATTSLDAIEHTELRAKFREPRVHFAIVCASIGCPPLRAEAYVGPRVEAQLEDQARRVHAEGRWLRRGDGEVALTLLYLWYGDDFAQVAGSVQGFVRRYRPELSWAGDPVWLEYDWRANGRRAVPDATLSSDARRDR